MFRVTSFLQGESSEAKFSVTNVCPFPLSWCAKFKGLRDPNLENRAPFFCRPAEGTLAQVRVCVCVCVCVSVDLHAWNGAHKELHGRVCIAVRTCCLSTGT